MLYQQRCVGETIRSTSIYRTSKRSREQGLNITQNRAQFMAAIYIPSMAAPSAPVMDPPASMSRLDRE